MQPWPIRPTILVTTLHSSCSARVLSSCLRPSSHRDRADPVVEGQSDIIAPHAETIQTKIHSRTDSDHLLVKQGPAGVIKQQS